MCVLRLQEKRKNLLNYFKVCWLFTHQPVVYTCRTALKAWGNDNPSDFRIFGIKYLSEQQSFSDCEQLERRRHFFPIPGL